MKAILVEDVTTHRDDFLRKIESATPEVHVVETAETVKEGIKLIHLHHPDIVFLDVELGAETGFDLLNRLDRIDFKVIFVSGYDKYAHRAFKYLALDYLLKPVDETELINAIGRAKDELRKGLCNVNIETLKLIGDLHKPFDFFCINDKKGFHVIHFAQLIKCEANGYCTDFFLSADDKEGIMKISSSMNIRHYEEQLLEHDFIRVHRSHIINSRHILRYSNLDQTIHLSRGLIVPLGAVYKKGFMAVVKHRL